MTSPIGQSQGRLRGMARTLYDAAGSVLAVLLFPAYALLWLLVTYPLVVYSFLLPLLSLLIYRYGRLLWAVPPLVALSIPLLLFGMIKHDLLPRIVKRNQLVFAIFAVVMVFEVLALAYTGLSGSNFFLGRMGFLLVAVAVAVNATNVKTMELSLFAITVGVAVLGVLTILHALDIFSLPVALDKLPARAFLGYRFPVPRTLGIGMSYGKFGIMASVAMVTLIFSTLSPYRIIKSLPLRIVLFLAVVSGILISQGRGVFLTVTTVSLFSVVAALQMRRAAVLGPQAAMSRSWLLLFAVMAILAIAVGGFLPTVAELDIVDVETVNSLDNAAGRVQINRIAVDLLLQNPLFGIGHGNFVGMAGMGTGIHNHFVEQYVATGFIGGSFYLLFYLLLLLSAWRAFVRGTSLAVRMVAAIFFAGYMAVLLEYLVFPGFLAEAAAWLTGLILALNTLLEDGPGETV